MRKRYNPEFRKDAVRMIVMDGLSVAEVSKKLGVTAGTLYKWKDLYLKEIGGSSEGDLNATELATELTKVRAELAKANRINEILKKTVSFMSKDEL